MPSPLTNDDKAALVDKIQRYLHDELNQDVGRFDAEFMLDFFAEEIGPFFYNKGLVDAQAILRSRLEQIAEAIYDLEQPAGGNGR